MDRPNEQPDDSQHALRVDTHARHASQTVGDTGSVTSGTGSAWSPSSDEEDETKEIMVEVSGDAVGPLRDVVNIEPSIQSSGNGGITTVEDAPGSPTASLLEDYSSPEMIPAANSDTTESALTQVGAGTKDQHEGGSVIKKPSPPWKIAEQARLAQRGVLGEQLVVGPEERLDVNHRRDIYKHKYSKSLPETRMSAKDTAYVDGQPHTPRTPSPFNPRTGEILDQRVNPEPDTLPLPEEDYAEASMWLREKQKVELDPRKMFGKSLAPDGSFTPSAHIPTVQISLTKLEKLNEVDRPWFERDERLLLDNCSLIRLVKTREDLDVGQEQKAMKLDYNIRLNACERQLANAQDSANDPQGAMNERIIFQELERLEALASENPSICAAAEQSASDNLVTVAPSVDSPAAIPDIDSTAAFEQRTWTAGRPDTTHPLDTIKLATDVPAGDTADSPTSIDVLEAVTGMDHETGLNSAQEYVHRMYSQEQPSEAFREHQLKDKVFRNEVPAAERWQKRKSDFAFEEEHRDYEYSQRTQKKICRPPFVPEDPRERAEYARNMAHRYRYERDQLVHRLRRELEEADNKIEYALHQKSDVERRRDTIEAQLAAEEMDKEDALRKLERCKKSLASAKEVIEQRDSKSNEQKLQHGKDIKELIDIQEAAKLEHDETIKELQARLEAAESKNSADMANAATQTASDREKLIADQQTRLAELEEHYASQIKPYEAATRCLEQEKNALKHENEQLRKALANAAQTADTLTPKLGNAAGTERSPNVAFDIKQHPKYVEVMANRRREADRRMAEDLQVQELREAAWQNLTDKFEVLDLSRETIKESYAAIRSKDHYLDKKTRREEMEMERVAVC